MVKKQFAQEVAEASMPAHIWSRDGQDLLISIDCRDTITPALLNASRGFSNHNHIELGSHMLSNEECQRNARYVWCDRALFRHGTMSPSPAQIAALRYAAEQETWFVWKRSRLLNRHTIEICTERGWLAEDGRELRITAEGRRMLRNAALDEEHARQNPPRRYRKRDRGGAGI